MRTVEPISAGPRPGRVEIALAALTLFLFAEAFLPKLLAPGADMAAGEDESAFLRYLWLPFYALIGLGLVVRGRTALRAIVRSPLLMLLAAGAIVSALWSINPETSLRRGIAVLATTLLGAYLAASYSWRDLLRLLGAVWLALMGMSLISGIVAPGFAVMDEVHPGAWAGGWWEKNQLGGHAARAAFLMAFLAWRDGGARKLWAAGAAMSVVLVVLSTSVTSMLGALLGFGVLAAAWWTLRGKRHFLFLGWVGVVSVSALALALAVAPAAVFGLIGRDPTLTGRTDIWDALAGAISQKPWLGYGYGAFWGIDSEPRYWIQQAVDWAAPSGHNGWLDLAIGLGLPAAGLFAVDVVLTLWRAAKLSTVSPAGVFALGALTQILMFSLSESILLAQNSIIWATYAAISIKLALEPPVAAGAPVRSAVQSTSPAQATTRPSPAAVR
ncbi:MAG: O-antigen ligase family protein [Hyphomonadaceae bacterium]